MVKIAATSLSRVTGLAWGTRSHISSRNFLPWVAVLIPAESLVSGRATVDLVPILGFDGVEADWASSRSFCDGLSLLVLSWSSSFSFLCLSLGPICIAFALVKAVCIE